MIGQRVNALSHDGDVRVRFDRARNVGGKGFAVDGERRAGGDAVRVGRAHDERAERPHLLMEQANRIVLGIVAAKAVRADHLGEAIGLMRRSRVAAPAHFADADAQARFGKLPSSFRPGQPAADDVNVEGHTRPTNPRSLNRHPELVSGSIFNKGGRGHQD